MFKKALFNCFASGVLLMASAHAVTLNVAGIANTTTGLITTTTPALVSNPLPSGRAIFVSVSNQITNFTALSNLLTTSTTTSAQFDLALAQVIASTNPTLEATTNPGIVRTAAFSAGALSAPAAATQVGNSGNRTYFFLVAEAGGFVTAIGAYTGNNVPTTGALTYNPATVGDTIGIGTSVLAPASGSGPTLTNASGFQLAAAIPETSTSLLGAIGALALLRRRRN
jgi:hypothetical protein